MPLSWKQSASYRREKSISSEDRLYPKTLGAAHRLPHFRCALLIALTSSTNPGWPREDAPACSGRVGGRMTRCVRIEMEPGRLAGSAGVDRGVQAGRGPLGHQGSEDGRGDS